MRPKQTRLARFGIGLVAGMLIALLPPQAWAHKFEVLHSFCSAGGCIDGEMVQDPLLMDAAGNLYGVTRLGGINSRGTAFELKRGAGGQYKFKSIWSFASSPVGPLVIDQAGNLYGEYRGSGGFKLAREIIHHRKHWTITDFQLSCSPADCGSELVGGLTYAGAAAGVPYDGTSALYGVATAGGSNNGGTVFKLTPGANQVTQTVLYNFCSADATCSDGRDPAGGVSLDANGNIFGLTRVGGNGYGGVGAGVAYELSRSRGAWHETVLYRFCSAQKCADGAIPIGTVALDTTGTLFGTTSSGGGPCKPDPAGCGTVFKIIPNRSQSQEVTLYTFCMLKHCRDGHDPEAGVALDASGNLFGTTYYGGDGKAANSLGGGILYELSGSTFEVLHRFCSLAACADGLNPTAQPIVGANGELFGTTLAGGAFGNPGGTAFQFKP